MSPIQKIYSEVRRLCVELYGEDVVYDYIPGEVSYPYIHLGDQTSQNIREQKDYIDRNTQIIIHVWHNDWKQRGELSNMMFEIEQKIIDEYGHDGELITSDILTDDTTSTMLLHGILDIDIKI